MASASCDIAVSDSAGIVARQAEIDAVPHAREFGMVIDLFGMQRDATEKAKGLAEILELEAPHQRLAAVLDRPSVRSIH